MTDPTQPGDEEGERRNVVISASDQSVAAYRIDTLIVEAAAELKAATTVLPIEAMVVEGPPFVGRESEMRRSRKCCLRKAMRRTASSL